MTPEKNFYADCEPLKYGGDSFMGLEETIDGTLLSFIIANRKTFEPFLSTESFDEGYDPFYASQKILRNTRQGVCKVNYRKARNVGRQYAVKSISMQAMTREIRHTIAREHYVDIDMKNAHPTILKWICDQNKINCPVLTSYVDDRDGFFKANDLGNGKKLMLAIMNGGRKDFEALETRPGPVTEFFYNEIPSIHSKVCTLHPKEYDEHVCKRVAQGITNNHEASFVNVIMCDIESKILDVMWRFWGSPKNCVLCFDGIMLPIGTTPYDLCGAENSIFEQLGVSIKLDVKPMDEGFDLSQHVIPPYSEMSLSQYSDYTNFIGVDVMPALVEEWMNNSIVLIDNGGKSYFLTKNFYNDVRSKEKRITYKSVAEKDVLNNLKVKVQVLNPYYNKALASEVKPLPTRERNKRLALLSDDEKASLDKYSYEMMGNDLGQAKGFLSSRLINRTLPHYNSVDFVPYLARNGRPDMGNCFNLFTGYPLERVPLTVPADTFINSKFYKHLRDELLGGKDAGEFEHFLDFIADIIQDPTNIKAVGHLFLSNPGMGKGMLCQFISKLVGSDHVITFENTEAYFSQFNSDHANKLVKVLEEVSSKGSAFKNHDRLKADLAKTTERIEPKGIDPYTVSHCARYLFFTNNENSLYIEGNDRRYTCHRANNRYANNYEYFEPIWAEVNDEQFCRSAFEFFSTREYSRRSVFRCYETQFKQEQKELNLSSGVRFIQEFIEGRWCRDDMDGDRITVRDLNDSYKRWCERNGVGFKVSSFKTQIKKLGLAATTKRFNGSPTKCYVMDIESLRAGFRDILGNESFEFEILDEEEDTVML